MVFTSRSFLESLLDRVISSNADKAYGVTLQSEHRDVGDRGPGMAVGVVAFPDHGDEECNATDGGYQAGMKDPADWLAATGVNRMEILPAFAFVARMVGS